MSEPWFDANHYAWIPGTVLGVVGGLWGATVGFLAPRGRGRSVVFGVAWLLIACSAALLVAGLVAWSTGQPYGIWYGLGLAGVIGLVVLGSNIPTVRGVYRAAEQRRMEARDLSL